METNNPSVKQTITEKVNSYQQQIQNQNKKIVNMMKSELGVDPEDPSTLYVPSEEHKVKH
jgi:flagellar hook-associated protein FlgK